MWRKRSENTNSNSNNGNNSNNPNNSNKETPSPTSFLIKTHVSPDIPEDFLCPISLDIMKDPVIAADGHTYERENITKWLSQNKKHSPLDGSKLSDNNLQENILVRKIINSFHDKGNDKKYQCNSNNKNKCENILVMNMYETLEKISKQISDHENEVNNFKTQINALEELNRKSMIEIKEKENTIDLLTKDNLSLKSQIDSNAIMKKDLVQREEIIIKLKENLKEKEYLNDLFSNDNINLKSQIDLLKKQNEELNEKFISNIINPETEFSNTNITKIKVKKYKLPPNGDLSGKNLGNDKSKAVAESIKNNRSLKRINLGSNQIGDEGAAFIAESLKHNKTCEWIVLHDNQIGNEGAFKFAEMIKTNNTLQCLWLFNNPIGDEGARALLESLKINKKLGVIWLGNNEFSDEMKRLLERNKKIILDGFEQLIDLYDITIIEQHNKKLNK